MKFAEFYRICIDIDTVKSLVPHALNQKKRLPLNNSSRLFYQCIIVVFS